MQHGCFTPVSAIGPADSLLCAFSFELALLICNKGGVLQCALGANEVLYQTSTVDRMARHFKVRVVQLRPLC